ncbi:MAG: hypothetical protein WEB90_00280 [Gemmatimonadota bacterium]
MLPDRLREELIDAFSKVVKNYREHRWEPAELNGGKFCEVVYSILKGHADGKYPARAKKPKNMVLACQQLETQAANAPRSIRIQIPRMLIGLYEIRNNRNVGHVGGDVDPSHMDALCVLQMSKWILAELIRVLHSIDVDDAAALVEGLVERDTPQIWEVNGKRRVLSTSLNMREKTLLLLHASSSGRLSETELVSWTEHSNPSAYRREVLRKLHRERLVEYDQGAGTVEISPLGIETVEDELLPNSA